MTGIVYFVRCEDYVKVGYSRDLKTRISDLQVGCPYFLELIAAVPGPESLEWIFHTVLRNKRFRGEWFVLDDEMRQIIKMMQKRLSCGRDIRIQTEGDVIALLDPRTSRQRSRIRTKRIRGYHAELHARFVIKNNQ